MDRGMNEWKLFGFWWRVGSFRSSIGKGGMNIGKTTYSASIFVYIYVRTYIYIYIPQTPINAPYTSHLPIHSLTHSSFIYLPFIHPSFISISSHLIFSIPCRTPNLNHNPNNFLPSLLSPTPFPFPSSPSPPFTQHTIAHHDTSHILSPSINRGSPSGLNEQSKRFS